MTEAGWLQAALGAECSALGRYESGGATVAYAVFRGVTLAAAGADAAAAERALRAKVERHAAALRAAPAIAAAEEVNVVAGDGAAATRRFVRPMDLARALLELDLGVDGALLFVDAATGSLAIATRDRSGAPQLIRLGEPVHGDDDPARPRPVPGRTPPAEREAELYRGKAARVRALLRCPACRGGLEDEGELLRCAPCRRAFGRFDGVPVLAGEDGYDASPHGQAKSQNTYGQQVLSLIEQHRDGWVLDCGSGSPTRGFYNVVHLDLAAYPEVDVVTDGGALPFADETFEVVLSEAVLEHVRDPAGYLREVARVLRPGGLLRVDVAFLQPYHGFPDHYFNMTRSGLELVVRRCGLEVVALEPGRHQHPFITLGLVLNGYVQGTPDAGKRDRLLATTIGDAVERLARGGGDPFDGLTRAAIDRLAAGFSCVARKPGA